MQTPSKKVFEIVIVVVLATVLVGSGFWLGWASGRKYPVNVVVTGVANMAPPGSTSTPADFATFWQAWQIINDSYLRNASTTGAARVQGAIGGLVQSLGDPYSEYFDPVANRQFQQDIDGNFGGIGAELGENLQSRLVVIAPLPGTPAARAGIKAGDMILGVNGTSTEGLSVDAAVAMIRGNVGTKVTLTVMRSSWQKPQDFSLTRETIEVPTVDFEMKGDFAHISLHEFTAGADQLFSGALMKALDKNAKGIVLDLRDDPGGYLEVAVDLAGYFLKPGTLVVSEADRNGTSTTYTASGNGALATFPIVVLVNGGSASAAEILSGALHDDRKAPLVGEKTFGKGTVQTLEPLADGSAIKLTVAHWVLPSGRVLDHDGIVPDYLVAMPTSTATGTLADPQLDKALQVLQLELK